MIYFNALFGLVCAIGLVNTILLLIAIRAVERLVQSLITIPEDSPNTTEIKIIEKSSNDIDRNSDIQDTANYSEPNTFDAYSASSSFNRLLKG